MTYEEFVNTLTRIVYQDKPYGLIIAEVRDHIDDMREQEREDDDLGYSNNVVPMHRIDDSETRG